MNTKELRKIAESATPGPWENFGDIYIYATKPESFPVADTIDHDTERGTPVTTIRGWGHLQYKGHDIAVDIQKANVKHIATFNPTTVLKLLDALEISLNALKEYQKMRGSFACEDTKTIYDPLGWTADIAISRVDEILGGET